MGWNETWDQAVRRLGIDCEIAAEIADLYRSKLFSAGEIAEHYGVSHQLVTKLGYHMWHERYRVSIQTFIAKHKIGRTPNGWQLDIPEHLKLEWHKAHEI